MPGSTVTGMYSSSFFALRIQGRRFMHLCPDTVSCAVDIVIAVSSFLDDVSACRIYITAPYTCFACCKTCHLGMKNDIVNLDLFFAQMSDPDGTGHITAVAVHDSTEIHSHKSPFSITLSLGSPWG